MTNPPPNAYRIDNEEGDTLSGPFLTIEAARDGLSRLVRHPRYGTPQIVACWVYVDIEGRRTMDILPRGSMSVNYGPDSTDPHRAVAFPSVSA
jgi:hypothetical protein